MSLLWFVHCPLSLQARVSFRRIEAFLSRSADDVRNEDVYGKAGSDRRSPDLAPGEIKIQNGEQLNKHVCLNYVPNHSVEIDDGIRTVSSGTSLLLFA